MIKRNFKKSLSLVLCTMLTIALFNPKTQAMSFKDNGATTTGVVMPKSYYKQISTTSYSRPKLRYPYSETINGVVYKGTLTLLEFQDVADGYVATYAGYISR